MATNEVHEGVPKVDFGIYMERAVWADEVTVVVREGEAEAKSGSKGVVSHVKASVGATVPG
jgi:hypothetical protein